MEDRNNFDEVPITEVLGAVGRELDTLGTLVEHIQEALSPVLSPALLADPGALAGLQELDRLIQTLRALSGVAVGLSGAADRTWTVGSRVLWATVPLADLATRLAPSRG